jgi:hypothetical protein
VVVDVKLAFEGGPDTEKANMEIPSFRSPASLWLSDPPFEAYSLFGKPKCSHRWCYNRACCTSDLYIETQKKQRYKIESDIKVVLEEYETEKQRGKEGWDRFKHLLKDKDITRLLPGAVPGFALRNRKWGKCSL